MYELLYDLGQFKSYVQCLPGLVHAPVQQEFLYLYLVDDMYKYDSSTTRSQYPVQTTRTVGVLKL